MCDIQNNSNKQSSRRKTDKHEVKVSKIWCSNFHRYKIRIITKWTQKKQHTINEKESEHNESSNVNEVLPQRSQEASESVASSSEDGGEAPSKRATTSQKWNSASSPNQKYSRKQDPPYNPKNDPALNVLNPLQMTLDQTLIGVASNGGSRGWAEKGEEEKVPSSSGSLKQSNNLSIPLLGQCSIESLLAQMKHGTECLHSFANAIKLFSREQIKQCDETLKLLQKSKQEYVVSII
ncbi:hypothetical protein RFI_14026 [Reticulomyxa filosa]|uniref:Uncharacterized protein n=1 Tax=Reticulomyxa filosa TaxID=46433 RepID=X6NA35_RETFI|nr:hypothetical protein RFI_14026 [Reticulomyxa filosa]|eukprot:ETO23160.1 hypothetical protein RFI_14026 [Reticulomyxa filosa]